MRLSRKKAIELCIELWTWLAETGKHKGDWPRWGEFGYILSLCWFCKYDEIQCKRHKKTSSDWCRYCPYNKKYGKCDKSKDTLYSNWCKAIDCRTRKKYAKLFLEQIKQCK